MKLNITKNLAKAVSALSVVIFSMQFAAAQNYYGTNFAAIDDQAHNAFGNVIITDNTAINSDTTAILLETPSTTNLITANGNFSTFVVYDYSAGKWAIFDENIVTHVIPLGMKFNVLHPTAHGTAFQHISDTSYSYNFTPIDNPAANGNPAALLFVRHTWIGSVAATALYDSVPVGVSYNSVTGKWNINHENMALLKPNTAYNVFVADTTGGRAFVHTTVAADTSSDVSYIHNPLIDGDSNAIIIITQNATIPGAPTVFDSIPVGVYYNGRNWGIYHQNLTHMHLGVSYNVLVASAPGTTGIEQVSASEMHFKVYPSPASGKVSINYTLNENSDVSIKIYGTDGRELSTVYEGRQPAGSHALDYNVSALQPGSYYVTLTSNENRATYPMVVLR